MIYMIYMIEGDVIYLTFLNLVNPVNFFFRHAVLPSSPCKALAELDKPLPGL